MTILIVDDVASNRALLRMIVERLGHAVLEARDGLEALRHLEEQPEIGAMILDITMPRLNGWGVLGRMRTAAEWNDVPVVLFTAVADRETVQRATALGVRHYLVKPATAERVCQTVSSALEHVGQRLEATATVLSRTGLGADAYCSLVRQLAEELRGCLRDGPALDCSSETLVKVQETCALVGAPRSAGVVRRLVGGVANQHGVTTPEVVARELALLLPALDQRLAELGPGAPTDAGGEPAPPPA
jgi:CheY-like chemotaxis protein